ncbi:MAG: CPBP family intramembrane metalloprotease [Firmicutes bacterium]|nr:CPBP family intramembrane metalloprotease [Bacillota bacterium]
MEQKQKGIFYNLVIVLLLLIFQQLASAVGRFVANAFTYNWIDQDGIFAWISVHHIVQMALALLAVGIIRKRLKVNFGFCFGNIRAGIKYTMIFSMVIFIYVLVSYYIGYANHSIQAYEYPLHCKNVIGTLGFQLLLSGPSEEILFRALPITVLIYSLGMGRKTKKLHISIETMLAAFLFSLAHINWVLKPFVIQVDWFQLIYAFILGICYGFVYEKSESIVYPMAMHSISNVLMVGVGYVFFILQSP